MEKEPNQFNAFDIGMHYLNLKQEKVSNNDVGNYMYRFIKTFAFFDAEKKCLEVELPSNKPF